VKIIDVNARIYDFSSATLIEGLRNLGHTVLCSEASNYGAGVAHDRSAALPSSMTRRATTSIAPIWSRRSRAAASSAYFNTTRPAPGLNISCGARCRWSSASWSPFEATAGRLRSSVPNSAINS
jgi:hypothetical protein